MNDIMFSVLIQAPYTPFLTELMYQNLKTLIDPASVQDWIGDQLWPLVQETLTSLSETSHPSRRGFLGAFLMLPASLAVSADGLVRCYCEMGLRWCSTHSRHFSS